MVSLPNRYGDEDPRTPSRSVNTIIEHFSSAGISSNNWNAGLPTDPENPETQGG
ncbi:hypothetical protein RvY_10258 [Ramazzottius varieornatus]|uniref:Uncharacterized protein n=1 Tax=Ramazzottius varieornatus TaxID=947166 RepID=A0A1D1VC66_RAMVA|nr:hypothetical protein RvY_10258 [Ramazzottius varieornatus]